MTQFLKQSTSTVISFGPFVDETDGVTLQTGLVSALDHATTGIKISKNGGALAVRHATVTATTYDSYGNYLVTLDTTDTNTTGSLRVQFCDATTNAPVWRDFTVLSARAYAAQVEGATFNAFGGRVWFVDPDTDGAGDSGTFDAPFDSLDAADASSEVQNGDTIIMLPGTDTVRATLTKRLYVRGVDVGACKVEVTHAAGAVTIGDSGTVWDGVFVVNNGDGPAISVGSGLHGVEILRTDMDSQAGANISAPNTVGLKIDNCSLAGAATVIDLQGAIGFEVSNTTIGGTGGASTDGNYAVIRADQGANGVIRNVSINYPRTNQATGRTTGIVAGETGGGIKPAVVVENCHVEVSSGHASATGGVYGYAGAEDGATDTQIEIRGGSVQLANAGSGATKHIDASIAGSVVTVRGGNSTASDVLGAANVQFVDADVAATKTRTLLGIPAVAPAANGGLPTVNASNEVAGVSGDVLGSVGAVSGDVQGNVVGDVEGNVQGSVNSISGVTFPANFAALAINASGHVSRVTLADTVTTLTEEVGGGTPAQVHNQEPVDGFIAKLGNRRDGVVAAFPTVRIAPGEVTHIWIDCSKLVSRNLEDVTTVASSNAEVAIDSSGVYGKYVSIVLDAADAEADDTTTITCNAVPFEGQVLKVSLSVVVDDD